jgi:formate dehydrogenase alpha subunit
VAGLAASFGSGAMTNAIEEIEFADVILATGTNTTENHPVIGMYVKRAVRKRGAKLIVIEPREIPLVKYSSLFLRQKPGTDVAWINGMMNVIIAEGLYAKEFVEKRTEGFEEVRKIVEKYAPAYVETITGIPAEQLKAAARLYATAPKATILYAMGITQHKTGTDNVRSLANLAMLCGKVGFESCGINPLRGQNNVQGACDMGCLPNVFPAYQNVTLDAPRANFEKAWGVKLPAKPGLTVVEMSRAADEGKLKALYCMGENMMLSDPDLHHLAKALKKLDLFVVQDIFLTETAEFAHVVLPAACFAEKGGTFTNTERRVQRVRKAVEPPGEARTDWEIVADLSTRMGYPMKYAKPRELWGEIRQVTPSYAGITYERIGRQGIQWPCPNTDHPGTKYLHRDRFTRGLGAFAPIEFIPPDEVPDKEYPLYLTTGRVLYHYHTGTMTRRSRGTNERYPESLVEIHPQDAVKFGIADGSRVRVSSRRGTLEVKANVTDRTPEGTIFMNFHFKESPVNMLTNPVLDPICKIPELKVCACKIEAA